MSIDAWITIAVTSGALLLAAFSNWPSDLILLGTVCSLLISGILSTSNAFAGFANEGLLTIAVLLVVTSTLKETGAMTQAASWILGKPKTVSSARAKMMFPAAFISVFINNTPLVSILAPTISDWAKKRNFPSSQLLIPLSFSIILGGLCSIIGTSSNLAVNGLLIQSGHPGLGLFEIAKVGIPCAIVGILFLQIFSKKLLPESNTTQDSIYDARQYTLEMVVEDGGSFVGKSIEEAGLRHLKGIFLAEIHRGAQVLAAVGPDEKLQAGDQLVFVGVVDSVIELQRSPGLKPATNQLFKLNVPRFERSFVEVVISDTCRLIGKSIREGRFRDYYNSVVIAVARNGERIQKRIGDIVLRPGDTLLLEALPSFLERHRNSRDFYLVSHVEGATPLRSEKAWISLSIFVGMLFIAAFGWLSMLKVGLLALVALLLTKSCSLEMARRSIDYRLLLALASSVGIGQAFQTTGAAKGIAMGLIALGSSKPYIVLIMIYLSTLLLSELVNRNAAAIVLFSIAQATAIGLGVNPIPFIIAIMVAASASFAFPLSYGPHLMVFGPGGYRYKDFLKMGLPLDVIVATLALWLIPIFWPF